VIHLDTHVALWLYVNDERRLGPVRAVVERNPLVISPVVVLELQLLSEVGRVTHRAEEIVAALVDSLDLRISGAVFAAVTAEAMALRWTRDPFDRLIVANALVDRARLLTKDATILANAPNAIWK
jgi:PIN domain nuclease of toxin-antitoxin system